MVSGLWSSSQFDEQIKYIMYLHFHGIKQYKTQPQ